MPADATVIAALDVLQVVLLAHISSRSLRRRREDRVPMDREQLEDVLRTTKANVEVIALKQDLHSAEGRSGLGEVGEGTDRADDIDRRSP